MNSIPCDNALEFFEMLNSLKHLSRRGWQDFQIPNHEQIAGHMYAMAMMTFLIDKESGLDKLKCMQLALVHDLAECIVGDITPRDNIEPEVKHKMELEAMTNITKKLGEECGSQVLHLYNEYAAKETPEAKFVKDLDRFDMLYTALHYEKRDDIPGTLQEFFDSTDGKFQHPFIVGLVKQLYNKRESLIDTSNKTNKS